jgi:hypothetical protein
MYNVNKKAPFGFEGRTLIEEYGITSNIYTVLKTHRCSFFSHILKLGQTLYIQN